MKTLHVIHSMDPRSGGPVAALLGLTAEQVRRGDQVTIVCTDVGNPADPPDGIAMRVCRGYGALGVLRRFRYSPDGSRAIGHLLALKATRPDAVHIHGLYAHLTLSAAAAANRCGVSHAIRPAGGLGDFARRQGASNAKRLVFNLILKRQMQRATFVHATSPKEQDSLRRLLPGARVECVPHGVTIPTEMELEAGKSVFTQAHPHLANRPFVLFMGRLHRKKGIDLLFAAFSEFSANNETVLVIAGPDDGYFMKTCSLAASLGISGRVVYTGFLEGTMKTGALALARIFVLPSMEENFGMSVVEAMAHGTPVLTCPEVDSHRYVAESQGGLVVPRSPRAFADGLRSLWDSDTRSTGERGREYAIQHLSWAIAANSLERLFAEGHQ